MKPKHIFWGLFFITIGLLILLYNLGVTNFELYGFWKLWPLIFVLWGVSYISGNIIAKRLIAGAIAIVLALALFSIFSSTCNFFGDKFFFDDRGNVSFKDDSSITEHYSAPYSSNIKNAQLEFEGGATNFRLYDTTNDLVSIAADDIHSDYDINSSENGGKSIVYVKMRRHTFKWGDHDKNRTILKLNEKPVWDMNFHLGAAAINLDLRKYFINDINVEMGAASLKIRFGDKSDTTNFTIKAGASSIHLFVPESSGCEIRTDAALSARHFDDFEKAGNNLYRTKNFDSAKKKIFLNLKAGISSLNVDRYSAGWDNEQ